MTTKVLVSGIAAASVMWLTMVGTSAAQGQRAHEAVSAEQAIECIRTAIAATPGQVESVEIDHERGQLVCEVEIITENGTKAEVHVDVATGKVVRGGR
jgi:uncharacterized membrane protein YkoI